MFRNALASLPLPVARQTLRKQAAYGVAAGVIATLLLAAPVAIAATPPAAQIITGEDCDPIVIPQPAKKISAPKKPATVKKAAQSAPAQPLPKPETLAEHAAKPKPRPKPKPRVEQVAAKPIIISDACPSAGGNKQDMDALPTNLADLIEPGAGSATPMVFPEPAAGSMPFSPNSQLSSLAPRTRNTAPGNSGPTVPLTPVGGGGTPPPGENPPGETPPSENPPGENPPGENPPGENPPGENPPGENPPGENPPGENPPGENPPGENPPGENPPGETPPPIIPPPPPVKVPEPGTLGVLLGGLAGMALLHRRRPH